MRQEKKCAYIMANISPVFLLSTLIIKSVLLRAQDNTPLQGIASGLQEKLSAYSKAHPLSNLYLHLDKTVYSPEETMWFKAYLLGDFSREAKVLYVRIVDEEKNMITDVQFPMYDIRAHGSIQLSKPGSTFVNGGWGIVFDPPRILLEGRYMLYAYTDHMLAQGDTNVFVQPFRINRAKGMRLRADAMVLDTAQLQVGGQVQVKVTVREDGRLAASVRGEYQLLAGGKEIRYGRLTTNIVGETVLAFHYPDLPDDQSLKVKLLFTKDNDHADLVLNLSHRGNPLTVNCYPEGGRLLPGGRVAVEVLDVLGNPVRTALRVLAGDSTVAGVSTDVLGMATITLPPTAGERYTIKAVNGKGSRSIAIPPADQPGGFGLKVSPDSSGNRAVIRNHGMVGAALLVLRSPAHILWSRKLDIAAGDSAIVLIPSAGLTNDILGLAVFDEDGKPHAERLFVSNETADYNVSIRTDQQDYGRHQKVTVTLGVTDARGNPVVANLSVSATERHRQDSTAFRSITQYGHYGHFPPALRQRLFAHKAVGGLDEALVGAKWQGLGWDRILSYQPGSKTLIPYVSGATGRIVPTHIKVRKIHMESQLGLDLKMRRKARPFYDRKTIEVNRKSNTFFVPGSLLMSRKGLEWKLKTDTYFDNPWRPIYRIQWLDPDIGFDTTLVRNSRFLMPGIISSYSISARPDVSVVNFRGTNLLEEAVVGRRERPVVRALRKTNCECYEEMVQNDYAHHQVEVFKTLNLVKGSVIKWNYSRYLEPITILYLGCGRYRDINYIKNITIPEVFRSPDYDNNPSNALDERSTVYWNPNVLTGADGTATFSFFTSDVTGDFEIVTQGLVESTLRPLMGTGRFKVANQ